MEQLALATIAFTEAELAEIKRRQDEAQKLIARLAATETFEQQEQLAGELCPRFDDWIRGRNRIQSTPARTRVPRTVTPRARSRERRPAGTRRSSSSSRTSSTDPGDPDPPGRSELRHISAVLADAGWIPCPFCGQPLHERDGAHCGGCAITWWEGVR